MCLALHPKWTKAHFVSKAFFCDDAGKPSRLSHEAFADGCMMLDIVDHTVEHMHAPIPSALVCLASWHNSVPSDPYTGPAILTSLFAFPREALYRRGILLLEHLRCKDVATPWCHAFVECCPSLRYKVRQIRGSLDRAEGMGDVNGLCDFGLSVCIVSYHHFYAWASMRIG